MRISDWNSDVCSSDLVAHTRSVYADDGSDGNVFSLKIPGMQTLVERGEASQIVPELAPKTGEMVVRKTLPSGFFGTNLAAWLTQRSVQTLLVAGCTTSGCVRSSVVDADRKSTRLTSSH